MQEFRILCEEEDFSKANAEAIETAMQGFVDTDVTLGVEFLFVDGEEIRRFEQLLIPSGKAYHPVVDIRAAVKGEKQL